ncbi:MAG TPA: parvulin peptidyl-prolyl isomerase [Rhodospirillaceae bacterium]|nr:parvulin peptidyl-prolyl isomerase [Rhodospirillaceae bacterium]
MTPCFKGAVALTAVLLTAATFPAFAADPDPVVATVNGTAIHRSALEKKLQSIQQHGQVPLEKVYDQLLDQAVVGELIMTQAKKLKAEDDPVFKAQLAELRQQLLAQFFLTKQAEAAVTEEATRKRYEEKLATTAPKEEVKVRHIVVATEEAAKQVIADLQAGTSFEDEAKAKSLDPSGKNSGGEIGYISKDRTVPEFSAAAFALKPGEYTQTPAHSKLGWHIIKVEDRRMAPPPAYEAERTKIKMELVEQNMQKIVEAMVKNAQVKLFNLDGTPKPEKAPSPH